MQSHLQKIPIGTVVSFKKDLHLMKSRPSFLFSTYVVVGYRDNGEVMLAQAYDYARDKNFYHKHATDIKKIWHRFLETYPDGMTSLSQLKYFEGNDIACGKDHIKNLRHSFDAMEHRADAAFNGNDWRHYEQNVLPRLIEIQDILDSLHIKPISPLPTISL